MANAKVGKKADAGFSLVEMIIAMVISGIVISLTLVSWAFISRHTTTGSRTSYFRSQVEQTASLIVNGIRTSQRVIGYDENTITFIDGKSDDTVTYSFDNDSLRKNKIPVPWVPEGAAVIRFKVERDEAVSAGTFDNANKAAGFASGSPEDAVFHILVGMRDRNGAVSEIPEIVKTRYVPDPGR